ncbi:hypothetical protein BZK28_05115 [Helicobacter pylori]|nr:hypothetical protein BZK28_05115 [Helicobacter pylori]
MVINFIRDRGCFEIIPPTTLRSLYKKLSPTSFLIVFILKNAFEDFYNFLFLFRLPNGFF